MLKHQNRYKAECRARVRVHKRRKCSHGGAGHLKRYAGLEDVHKRRKCSHRVTVTKTVRRAGRCSQTSKMFTHAVERITKAVCRAGRCSQTSKMFTRWSGSLKLYAGLEDVHKRRKCSHRVTVTKTVRRAGRCSQTSKMFTQWSGSLRLYAGLKMFTNV